MGNNKTSLLFKILLILGLIYILNPFRLVPALAKLRLKSAVLVLLLVIALIIAVIYSAFHQKTDKPEEKQLTDSLSTKGRQRVIQLRSLGMNIKNNNIKQKTEEICKSVEKLLDFSADDTDKALQTDRFIENYLTTLGSVLTKFARLETNGSLTGEVTANAISCLEKILEASENQQKSIVANDIMDIAVEMETLLAMCKRDGLLAEEGFSFSTGEEKITLVL